MILEYRLDYRSASDLYQRTFLQTLKESNLQGNISQDHFELRLFVESTTVEALEAFVDRFAEALPHSLFLYDTQATLVEQMPSEQYSLQDVQIAPTAPCPRCLKELTDPQSENYYNIFTHCSLCGYDIQGETKSYQPELHSTAQAIQKGEIIAIDTMYGRYSVGLVSDICDRIECDLMAYDLATVERYTHCEAHELKALSSIEKPAIRLHKKLLFSVDLAEIERELFYVRFADDAILSLLMEELHALGVAMIFISGESIESQRELTLIPTQQELEPLRVVASPKHTLIVSGNRGLPQVAKVERDSNPAIDRLYTIMDAYRVLSRHQSIVGINLDREQSNNIIVYGEKFGVVEYLSFDFSFDSIDDIFTQIASTNESAKNLMTNYRNKFPEHYDSIKDISFADSSFNIYKLWGIMAIILDFTPERDLDRAADIVEQSAMVFQGERGPRIDYKLINRDGKAHFDPLMSIRTAMSFKLAGVDQLSLSYGMIESFIEFINQQQDELIQNMQTTATVVTGSLLDNRVIFSKMSRELSASSDVYFANNSIAVIL